MEFQRERVYTALNADELRAGDKVIVANTLAELRKSVEENCIADVVTLKEVHGEDCLSRFITSEGWYPLAYLYVRKPQPSVCDNCRRSKWGGDRSCVLEEGYGCNDYEPKRAEKKYRPFANTDELIKVWDAKCPNKRPVGMTMPLIWVRRKEANTKGQLITEFGDGWGVGIGRGEAYNMTDLWVHFTFLDGSVCGVEE